MPSAVLCSLLGGISSVIEIHFSIEVNQVQWTDQWLLSSVGLPINDCLKIDIFRDLQYFYAFYMLQLRSHFNNPSNIFEFPIFFKSM